MYSWKVMCLAVFKSIQGFKVPTELKVWKWEKWCGSQILKHSHAFLMHVTITTVFASLHSKREAHNCEGQKDRKIWEWICCCQVFFECLGFFIFVNMFIEGTGVLCGHLNRCHESVCWHLSYPLIWKCVHSVICYTYCYILDVLFLTTGLPMWKCSYFIHLNICFSP